MDSRGASTDPAFAMCLASAVLQLSSEEAGFLHEIGGGGVRRDNKRESSARGVCVGRGAAAYCMHTGGFLQPH